MNDQDSGFIRETINHAVEMVRYEMQCMAACYRENATELNRPFMLLKPKVFPDGNMWCALYGENLQAGVCAFGETPHQASIQFDVEWLNSRLSGVK